MINQPLSPFSSVGGIYSHTLGYTNMELGSRVSFTNHQLAWKVLSGLALKPSPPGFLMGVVRLQLTHYHFEVWRCGCQVVSERGNVCDLFLAEKSSLGRKKGKEGKRFEGTLRAPSIGGGYTTLKVGLPLSLQIRK